MAEIKLYHRTGCHLCEDMRQTLVALQTSLDFSLCEIDIDDNPGLQARYGRLIPVLCLGEREICHYPLNVNALSEALEAG